MVLRIDDAYSKYGHETKPTPGRLMKRCRVPIGIRETGKSSSSCSKIATKVET